jgi:hypothetical protein
MHYTTKSVSADGLAFSIWPAYADGVATEKLDPNDSAEESAVILLWSRSAVYQKRRSGHNPPPTCAIPTLMRPGRDAETFFEDHLTVCDDDHIKRELLKGALLDLEGDQTRPSVVRCYQIIDVILT